MSGVPYDFAVVGGDLRQVYLADILKMKGYSVVEYGLLERDTKEEQEKGNEIASSLEDAVKLSRGIVCPIPFSKDQIHLSFVNESEKVTIKEFEQILKRSVENDEKARPYEKKQLYGGCIPEELSVSAQKYGILTVDFMKVEELAVFNSIATAEGALAEAILHHPCNLHKSACLVLGYGRCAATLAHKLAGLSANVTVCARKSGIRAKARARGYDAIGLEGLGSRLSSFQYIFNTIPKAILDRELLGCVGRNALIIDLASAPGGLDYPAAKELGIQARLCPGLPGKYAPKSSAEAMVKVLLQQEKSSV